MSEFRQKILAIIETCVQDDYGFDGEDETHSTFVDAEPAAKAIEILVLEEKIKLLDKIYKLSDTIELFRDLNYELNQLKQQVKVYE